MKDPLRKSEVFVTMLREHCRNVHIRELEAGNLHGYNPLHPLPCVLGCMMCCFYPFQLDF
jgi:hypothetical protein